MPVPIAGFSKPYHDLTILDFQDRFPNEKSCWEYLLKMRWPDGCACPKKCDSKMDKIGDLFQCRKCKAHLSITTGTMFHKSRLPLRKWFWAIFLMATSKKGMSMLYLQRQLGIKSYRTAWLMGHKIRHAMLERDALYTLNGTVQADEIFIGGKQTRAEQKASGTNKTAFLIGVEEDEKERPRFVTFEELEAIYDQQIVSAVEKNIKKGSMVKSDGSGAYKKLKKKGYQNLQSIYTKYPEQTIAHLKWVNMITSNLKRFLLSTYHGVFPKYRDAYLAEFAYRFNRRYWPHQAFDRLLFACVHAKPMTLETLRA